MATYCSIYSCHINYPQGRSRLNLVCLWSENLYSEDALSLHVQGSIEFYISRKKHHHLSLSRFALVSEICNKNTSRTSFDSPNSPSAPSSINLHKKTHCRFLSNLKNAICASSRKNPALPARHQFRCKGCESIISAFPVWLIKLDIEIKDSFRCKSYQEMIKHGLYEAHRPRSVADKGVGGRRRRGNGHTHTHSV